MTPRYDIRALKQRYPDTRFPIYMDYQATTPLCNEAAMAMQPFLEGTFGNPHSKSHAYGWAAEAAVEAAREHIASLVGAQPRDIIFTSGATEANNLAIKGAARALKISGKNHIITSAIEHKCVIDACRALEQEGFRVTYLSGGTRGLIDPQQVREAMCERTGLVSIMMVNNEIGTIQPIEDIAAICHEYDVLLHTDAAQAIGKIPVDAVRSHVAMMSISAHKMYGPLGIGALYIRRKPRVRLEPLIHGGGQERNMRSGTLSPMLCAGFGAAASTAAYELHHGEPARVQALIQRFFTQLKNIAPESRLNGDDIRRIPGNCNICLPNIQGEELIRAMRDIAVSAGSACASSQGEASYVLRDLGLSEEHARASIRFSIGRYTQETDIDAALDIIAACVPIATS